MFVIDQKSHMFWEILQFFVYQQKIYQVTKFLRLLFGSKFYEFQKCVYGHFASDSIL